MVWQRRQDGSGWSMGGDSTECGGSTDSVLPNGGAAPGAAAGEAQVGGDFSGRPLAAQLRYLAAALGRLLDLLDGPRLSVAVLEEEIQAMLAGRPAEFDLQQV